MYKKCCIIICFSRTDQVKRIDLRVYVISLITLSIEYWCIFFTIFVCLQNANYKLGMIFYYLRTMFTPRPLIRTPLCVYPATMQLFAVFDKYTYI